MKKNILVTSALAGSLMFLGSNAIAQTKIDGTLVIGYKSISYDATASKQDGMRGLGREAQLNVSNSGNLNVGGLKYAAGFALEFDGASEKNTVGNISIGNENTYIDIIAGNTTLTFGVDHIQNSDRSTAHFVGLNFEDLDNGNTFFQSSVGANPKEAIGAGIVQSTPFGNFSYWYVPANGINGGDDDLDGMNENAQGTAVPNKDRASAYEIGFVGDFGVKGLNVHLFKNEEKKRMGQTQKRQGENYGIKYTVGQITAGINRIEHNGANTALSQTEDIKEMHYGLAYAVTPNFTIGANYYKAEGNGKTEDAKVKVLQMGYNLGPVALVAGVAKAENIDGTTDDAADLDRTGFVRLIGAF